MMRRLQPIGPYRQGGREEGPFGSAVNIAGQQQAFAVGAYTQYTGFRIAASGARPLPQFKRHTVPLPLLATDTGLGIEHCRQALGFSSDYPLDCKPSGLAVQRVIGGATQG